MYTSSLFSQHNEGPEPLNEDGSPFHFHKMALEVMFGKEFSFDEGVPLAEHPKCLSVRQAEAVFWRSCPPGPKACAEEGDVEGSSFHGDFRERAKQRVHPYRSRGE